MIKASGLIKRYKKKVVVDNLSFEVALNKVTGFLGPNGAGKSTTMRLMLGLDHGGGKTTFDGKPLNKHSRPSEVAGILLEAKAYHPTRSARNHLRVLAAQGGIRKSRVDEVLEVVGLTEVAKKKPGKFSLGMSQRLGIAAAILAEPKYLILDEPANGLDPEGIAWLREFIKKYATRDRAVLVSSHLLSEMSLMADNVVVIGRGKLIADTSIKQLLSGSGHSAVLVRSDHQSKLERLLKQGGILYDTEAGGLVVRGATTDKVGKLAYQNNISILELTTHSASLEEAFLELTAGSEEYIGEAKK